MVVDLTDEEMQSIVNACTGFFAYNNAAKNNISLEMSVSLMKAFEKFKKVCDEAIKTSEPQ